MDRKLSVDPNPLPTDTEMYELLQDCFDNPLRFTIIAKRLNLHLVDYRITDVRNGGRVATCFTFENAIMCAIAMNHTEDLLVAVSLHMIQGKFHA